MRPRRRTFRLPGPRPIPHGTARSTALPAARTAFTICSTSTVLHHDDRQWVQRPARCIEHWRGDRLALGPGVTLVRTGGHFPGSTSLHWATGPRGGGALFAGDSPQVASNRRSVSFLYSSPNFVPLGPREVIAMRERLAGLAYDDVYGYSWGRNIIGDGQAAVEASFDRHLHLMAQT